MKQILGLAGFALAFVGLTHPAWAVLGEPQASIEADRQALAGVRSSPVVKSTYSVHEIVSNGVNVREYVSRDGRVFGLAWDGHTSPDLAGLLGTYFSEYQRLSEGERVSKGRVAGGGALGLSPRKGRYEVRSDQLVVQKYGHMRALRGRAFVPNFLPAGMKPNEIN